MTTRTAHVRERTTYIEIQIRTLPGKAGTIVCHAISRKEFASGEHRRAFVDLGTSLLRPLV